MLKFLTATASLIALAGPVLAQTDIRFTLGWKIQGSDAPILPAQERGYLMRRDYSSPSTRAKGPPRP